MVITRVIKNLATASHKSLTSNLSFVNHVSRVSLGLNNHHQFNQSRSFCLTSNRFSERRYHDKHEWVTIKDKIATVGISEYAQKALGDIVFVELPEPNRVVEKDDEVGCVESTKSANDIYTPLSGKITEVNERLESEPHLINSSPYEEGWIYKMEVSNEEEFPRLMNEEQYQTFVKIQSGTLEKQRDL